METGRSRLYNTGCTGIMIPSLDAYLINKLKLRQDIVRLPVTEMGCAAGYFSSSMPRTSTV
jgi:predicted naringenin-chalcone synthase